MQSLISRRCSSRVLFSASAIAIALIMLATSPAALARKKLTPMGASVGVTQTAQTTAQTDSHSPTEVGMGEWFIQERVIFLSGDIDPTLAELVISQLLYLDRKSPGKDIYLYINSAGGEINSGLAIYDTIRALRSDVVTVGLGEASSMGSFLLASGTRGKRVALPNTRIMIHQPWQPTSGMQASDVAIAAREILYQKSLLNRLLSELTGQPLKRIETDTDRDFYMSAQEAKAYGIIDHTPTQLPSATRPLKN